MPTTERQRLWNSGRNYFGVPFRLFSGRFAGIICKEEGICRKSGLITAGWLLPLTAHFCLLGALTPLKPRCPACCFPEFFHLVFGLFYFAYALRWKLRRLA